jgi:hypothetical protein
MSKTYDTGGNRGCGSLAGITTGFGFRLKMNKVGTSKFKSCFDNAVTTH